MKVSNLFQCKQQEFHVYHMHIELRWFFVTLMYSRTMWYQYTVHAQLEEFENTLAMIINDLIYSALKVFERVSLYTIKEFDALFYNSANVYALCLFHLLLVILELDHGSHAENTVQLHLCTRTMADASNIHQ